MAYTSENLIEKIKSDMGDEWIQMCIHYHNRKLTTILNMIEENYGELPLEFEEALRKEMSETIERK